VGPPHVFTGKNMPKIFFGGRRYSAMREDRTRLPVKICLRYALREFEAIPGYQQTQARRQS